MDLALILLGLDLNLPSASASSVFMVPYIFFKNLVTFLRPFSELSLVGMALDLVD